MPEASVIGPGPDPDENWYRDDPLLGALLAHYAGAKVAQSARPLLDRLGRAAPAEIDAWARQADRNPPTLAHGEPRGREPPRVAFHPSYERLREAARAHRVFTLSWHPLDGPRPPRTVAFALGYLFAQAEAGYYCPACMTDGAALVLDRHAPAHLRDAHVPRLVALQADGAEEGAMYLTERGGGSDVGEGTRTVAEPGTDGTWRLSGLKWFASNCTAHVALALARVPDAPAGTGGLGLFLVPRRLADGSPNPGVRIERLKPKLGVASMATGEVCLDGAVAHLVKGPGDGIKAMLEMVNLSRLYNAVTSVAVARRALREGQRAGRDRVAFGRPLHEHPLYLRGLVKLAVETDGAMALTWCAIDAFDRHLAGDEDATPLMRMLVPAAKAATALLAVRAASQGCEFLGGNGYIEDYVTPRLLRDAQVLPIWEGTTNIQALEFIRALALPGSVDRLVRHGETLALPHRDAPPEATGALIRDGLAAFASEVRVFLTRTRPEREVAALRILLHAFHLMASAVLACLSRENPEDVRLRRVADLYARIHLSPAESDAALEHAVGSAGRLIAYGEPRAHVATRPGP